ncbi:MAG: outer membrane lipoprotein carrier protein LolA [Ignavibacteriae bacterium]|nr:outer membrane lipoprotein carrier protein LolA [Ignavibacteriota bacterium]
MILLFLLIISLFQNQTETLIKKIQEKFEITNNLKAEFVQSANNVNVMNGKFYFSQKNNYRIELEKNTIISDGKTIWNVDNSKKKVIISNVEDDPLAFSLREYIYDYPKGCKVTEEKIDENNFIIFLDATDSNFNFKNAKLWINSDFIITKILIEDFNGGNFEFRFSEININTNLSPSIFNFQENKGLKIIDLR